MKYSFSNKPHNRGGNSRGVRALGPKSSKKSSQLDINRFINKAQALSEQTPYVSKHTFADFGFEAKIATNLADKGYKQPSAIQDQAIPVVMEGKDVIGLANTGTGKTAAFLLPIINSHLENSRLGPALIMVPTRELAVQIKDECIAFTKGTAIRSAVCVGGQNIYGQISQLKRNPQIIIGTPGRLKDLHNQNKLRLDDVSVLVLDEVDRMLDMGFIHDMRAIVGMTPNDRQSLFFSATMTREIESMAHTFQKNPVTISVVVSETSNHVEQNVIYVASQDAKAEMLIELLEKPEFSKVIVFGATKWGVQKLAHKLEQAGVSAAAIHGDKTQGQRMRALNDFKAEKARALIATDVAARGLDIPLVTHVINYDIPQSYDDYTHRIGRTGRAGNSGNALTFVVGRAPSDEYPNPRMQTQPRSHTGPTHKPFAKAFAGGGQRSQFGGRNDRKSSPKSLSTDGQFSRSR